MAVKFLPRVSKCFCLVELPLAALLIACTDLLFSVTNVILFYQGMICNEDYCNTVWLQFLFLAPYAWLALAAVILIITYFDRSNKDLLMFAVMIKLVLVVVFLIILILIFINDELHHDPQNGSIFLILGLTFLFLLIYFSIVMNSWHAYL